MIFLFTSPSFADGGIPLSIMNAPTLFVSGLPSGIKGIFTTFVLSLILLIFIALLETLVSQLILKNTSFTKLF